MSDEHAVTNIQDGVEQSSAEDKGKGKLVSQVAETHVDEDDEDDDDEEEEEDEDVEAEQGDDDGMDEMDLNNIVGRRTRGNKIDFAKAAEELGPEEDDDEEDEEFQPPAEDTEMAD